jgi:hypothetical protein
METRSPQLEPGGRSRGRRGAFVVAHALAVASLVVAAPLVVAQPAAAQYGSSTPWDASLRELRKATTYANDGSHHPRLVALRQLNDPALRPLFQSLVQGKHWTIQIDGILGLAELDPKGMIDPFLLDQLKGDTDRSTGISAAVSLDMVGREQAEAMLGWDDLAPRDRVVLMGELVRRGGSPDAAKLAALTDHRNDEVAGIATLIRATVTGEAAALDAFRSRFGALPARERERTLIALANASMQFRLGGAVAFLNGCLQDATLSTDARFSAIGTLLTLDPAVGVEAWKQAVAADASQATRVRLGLIAIAADATLPKGAGAALRTVPAGTELDPLIARLADVIDALVPGPEQSATASQAFPALVSTRHRPSLAAMLEAAKRLPSDAQRATYAAFLELAATKEQRELTPAIAEMAVEAVSRLGTVDVGVIEERLTKAAEADETRLHDILLLALIQTNTSEAAAVAMRARPKASRRGAALALLLHARFASELSKTEIDELGVIASGGWTLDPGLEVQAAWLFARHSGRAEEAIAAILKP